MGNEIAKNKECDSTNNSIPLFLLQAPAAVYGVSIPCAKDAAAESLFALF